ncbi:hypothetical protein [Sphingomonas aurantiaca]|uniref:hypothetical protein n=1 Tax=Sphingomonas aurantiaca TaxID=185949 RepID=UPI003A5C50C9
MVLDGYCYGQKDDGEGKSQIVSLAITGDSIGLEHLYLRAVDHDTRALTGVVVATVPLAAVRQIAARRPAIAQALGSIRRSATRSRANGWSISARATACAASRISCASSRCAATPPVAPPRTAMNCRCRRSRSGKRLD